MADRRHNGRDRDYGQERRNDSYSRSNHGSRRSPSRSHHGDRRQGRDQGGYADQHRRRDDYSRRDDHGRRDDGRRDGRGGGWQERGREPRVQVFGRASLFEKHFSFDLAGVGELQPEQLFVDGTLDIRPGTCTTCSAACKS